MQQKNWSGKFWVFRIGVGKKAMMSNKGIFCIGVRFIREDCSICGRITPYIALQCIYCGSDSPFGNLHDFDIPDDEMVDYITKNTETLGGYYKPDLEKKV